MVTKDRSTWQMQIECYNHGKKTVPWKREEKTSWACEERAKRVNPFEFEPPLGGFLNLNETQLPNDEDGTPAPTWWGWWWKKGKTLPLNTDTITISSHSLSSQAFALLLLSKITSYFEEELIPGQKQKEKNLPKYDMGLVEQLDVWKRKTAFFSFEVQRRRFLSFQLVAGNL